MPLGNPYLWEFVTNFTDPFTLLANDGAMESLLNDQILGTLIFLKMQFEEMMLTAGGPPGAWGAPHSLVAPQGVGSQQSALERTPTLSTNMGWVSFS